MNILFITNCYYPNGDATSVVVHNLARAFLKKHCNVHVLVLTYEGKSLTICEKDGVRITNLLVPELGGLRNIFNNICIWKPETMRIFFEKIVSVLKFRYSYAYKRYYELPAKLKGFIRGIKKIISEEKVDLIIPTLMPSEAGHALICMKDISVPFAVYQLDTYWNNATLPQKYSSDRLELERHINKRAIFNITTPQIFKSNLLKDKRLTRKQIVAEFPMILEDEYCGQLGAMNDIRHAVFLGTLYADIRPPEKIIKIISNISRNDLIFDFYGSNQNLVSDTAHYIKAKCLLALHGEVPTEEAGIKKREADFLVNIDNTCPQQVPSKIFEYISTGKPIINFYFTEESSTIPYLKRYPLVLNINVNITQPLEAARKIESFVEDSFGENVSWEYIVRTYKKNTPEYVADQFLAAYEKFCTSEMKNPERK